MKKIIAACLLSMATLVSIGEVENAHRFFNKVVKVTITGWVLSATSDTEDGTINKIEIYNLSTGEKVRQQFCGDYSCSISLNGLPHGNYSAKVICVYTVFTQQFAL